jgi:CDP-glucose 4,6-dehydratase
LENMEIAEMKSPSLEFWRGKRVLITGHNGFKGTWLTIWLSRMGALISGISLPANTSPALYDLAQVHKICQSHYCDIREAGKLNALVNEIQPQIVFHLAAQSLVRSSYQDPLGTLDTNVMGTANLLNALRGIKPLRTIIVVTSDKVYRNQEWVYPYKESDELGGHDPYSASKAAAELIVSSYRDSFLSSEGVALATARAGNVIGGGDWSENRLIPDAVRAWDKGQTLHIRRPLAVRPWQHVLEPLSGYLLYAQRLWNHPDLAGACNFGPQPEAVATVQEVIKMAQVVNGTGSVSFGDGSEGPHEAGMLVIETAKARSMLNFIPRWSLMQAVQFTINWYRRQKQGEDALALSIADIEAYEKIKHP